jgi:hypothetical protein
MYQVPEMNSTLERKMAVSLRQGFVVFALQSVGLIIGLTLMYLMSLYGSEISFE